MTREGGGTSIYRHPAFEEGRESGGPLSDTPRQTSDGGGFDGGVFPFWRSQTATSPSPRGRNKAKHAGQACCPRKQDCALVHARKIPDRISPSKREAGKKVRKFKVIEEEEEEEEVEEE